jgi:hypothetical protein
VDQSGLVYLGTLAGQYTIAEMVGANLVAGALIIGLRATKANVVALHPAAIAIYLDTVEELAKALSASDAKAACLKLRELIDCIVVAPRVKPGDPIHFEVRGRLAALMRPAPGRVSVGALVPRGGIEPSTLQQSASQRAGSISRRLRTILAALLIQEAVVALPAKQQP